MLNYYVGFDSPPEWQVWQAKQTFLSGPTCYGLEDTTILPFISVTNISKIFDQELSKLRTCSQHSCSDLS